MQRYHPLLNDNTTVTKNQKLCGWKHTSFALGTNPASDWKDWEAKECFFKIGGHQADILTQDISHTRLEWHTLNLIIDNLGSKSKSPSKYIHAVCTSSPKQTPGTLWSSTLPSLSYTCTEFLAGPGIWNGMLQIQNGHLNTKLKERPPQSSQLTCMLLSAPHHHSASYCEPSPVQSIHWRPERWD